MSTLYILIDSSTRRSQTGEKYGESVAAWAAWWEGRVNEKPIRCGIHYFHREGPNKVFYQGIIRALEQCMDLIWEKDKVIIYGDCELVLKQLRKEWNVRILDLYFRQVQALKRKYRGQIYFKYLNEDNMIYKRIDELSKFCRKHIPRILKHKKR